MGGDHGDRIKESQRQGDRPATTWERKRGGKSKRTSLRLKTAGLDVSSGEIKQEGGGNLAGEEQKNSQLRAGTIVKCKFSSAEKEGRIENFGFSQLASN